MKNLWQFTRVHTDPANSVSLPSYVRIAFTNPVITPNIHQDADLSVRVIGHCVKALVVNKLTADINSRIVPVNKDELTCLSAILATESREVRLCLSQPGTIELVSLASLALGDITSLGADQMQPGMRPMLQQTLDILSQAFPPPGNAPLPLDQRVALVNVPDDNFERTTISRLHVLLTMCIPGGSSLTEEVRISCLRMCLKTLWYCAKAHHQSSNLLPSYFPLVFASPEVARHFQTEQDPVSCIAGCCFWALIVSKQAGALGSPISLSGGIHSAELAWISAILGSECHEDLLFPHQLRIINFRNIVSVISGKITALSTGAGMQAEVLNMTQATLSILANRLRDNTFGSGGVPRDQQHLLQEIYSGIMNALSFDQLKNETAKTLNRLRQILEKTTARNNRAILPVILGSRGLSLAVRREPN
jgi:hypothetical protein